jgi:hypothetical protein
MRALIRTVAAITATLIVSTSVGAPASADPAPPSSPVGAQVAWLLDVSHRLPLSLAEASEHIDPTVLDQIGLDALNQALATVSGTTGLSLVRYRESSPSSALFVVASDSGTWLASIALTAAGLIGQLFFTPLLPEPTSWSELDQRLQALAPRVSFLAATLDEDGCEPVHAVAADTARPIGSAFKLYVLGALATAVAAGRAAWDEPLSIRDSWKSLPSGTFQDLPAGTTLPLSAYAANMIASSDNTATDHLIHRLGRSAVVAQQVHFGMTEPGRNVPFLLTRDLFVLKLTAYPHLVDAYAALPSWARQLVVPALAVLPLPTLEDAAAWTTPRRIDVEWFASPADICAAFAGLAEQAATPGLEPVDDILSINDGGLLLDPASWDRTWFKGGSEPGVLTLNYLARTSDGRTFVVSAMVSDPEAALPEAFAVAELQALIRGAFTLASGVAAFDIPVSAPTDAEVVNPVMRPVAVL